MVIQSKKQTLDPYINLNGVVSFQKIDGDMLMLHSLKDNLEGSEMTEINLSSHPSIIQLWQTCHNDDLLMKVESKLVFTEFLVQNMALSKEIVSDIYSRIESLNIQSHSINEKLRDEVLSYYLRQIQPLVGMYRHSTGKLKVETNTFVKFLLNVCEFIVMKSEDGEEYLYLYNHFTGTYSKDYGTIARIIHWAISLISSGMWNKSFEKFVIDRLLMESAVVKKEEFDKTYINLLNGALNLETLEFGQFSNEFLCTRSLPVTYNSQSKCPKFEKFVSEIMEGDLELINILQEMTGYILCDHTKAQKAFFFFGKGSNGKSLYAEILQELVSSSLTSNVSLKNLETRFGMEPLLGSKLNISSENEVGEMESNENFKAISAGDRVNVDRKGQIAINTQLESKLVFLTNNLPTFVDSSHALLRRLIIIPFNRCFQPEEQNKDLKSELVEELPAILNWAIEGLQRLKNNNYNFSNSSKVNSLIQSYQHMQNPVEEFCKNCLQVDQESKISRKTIIDSYVKWAKLNAIHTLGTERPQKFWVCFRDSCKKLGFEIYEVQKKGYYQVVGLNFKFLI